MHPLARISICARWPVEQEKEYIKRKRFVEYNFNRIIAFQATHG